MKKKTHREIDKALGLYSEIQRKRKMNGELGVHIVTLCKSN